MSPRNNVNRMIVLGLVFAHGGVVSVGEASGQPSSAQASADGAMPVNDLYSLMARCNEAILQLGPVRNSPEFSRLKSLQTVPSSGRTPGDIALRLQRMCGLVNRLRIKEGLVPIATSGAEPKAIAVRQVYQSAGQCLDGLIGLIAATDPKQSLGRYYQRTEQQAKTADELYGVIDLAVRRLEVALGEPPSQIPVLQKDEQATKPEAVVIAAPVIAAPVIAAPVIAAPVIAASDAPVAIADESSVEPPEDSAALASVDGAESPASAAPEASADLASIDGGTSRALASSNEPGDVLAAPAPPADPAPVTEHVLAMLQPAITVPTGDGAQQEEPPAPPPAIEIKRPKFNFRRYKEDWSGLKDAPESQLTDPWDSIKYVPLSDDGNIWASFGGQLRIRGENWSGFAFGAPADSSDTFVLLRGLVHSDIHFGEDVRAFVEIKSALSSNRDLPGGKRTLDVDSLALQQAFVDVNVPTGDDAKLTLRAGRQSFMFGKQRLVSPLPWANTLRAWDGVSAIVEVGDWNIHGFWTQYAPVRKYDANTSDAQTQFFGAYATGKIPNTQLDVDVYFLGLKKEDAVTFNGTTGPEDRYTVGGRTWGKIADTGFDYDIEGALQFGEVGSGDIGAFMVATEIGYTPADWSGSPRFKLGLDYASGDDAAGGDVGTFSHLFPLGHAYFGYMDFVGRQNIIDISPGVTFKPMDNLTASATGHLFWRAETADALYHAGGGVVRAGALSSAEEIGSEVDFILKYTVNRNMTSVLGYSHFFAGDFIEESGSSDDMDWIFFQLQYTF